MPCYLVRHGQAAPGPDDAARALTVLGRAEIEELAEELVGLGATVAEIRHSGLLRARQTAELLAAALAPRRGVRPVAGLAPDDPPALARDALLEAREPVMLVGHLPHLARLASLLVRGVAMPDVVPFHPGTAACLVEAGGAWAVGWVVTAGPPRRMAP